MTSGLNYDDGRTEMRPWTQVGEHKDGRCSIWRKRNKLGRGGGGVRNCFPKWGAKVKCVQCK